MLIIIIVSEMTSLLMAHLHTLTHYCFAMNTIIKINISLNFICAIYSIIVHVTCSTAHVKLAYEHWLLYS